MDNSSADNQTSCSVDNAENNYECIDWYEFEDTKDDTILDLLKLMSQDHYTASTSDSDSMIYSRCKRLFEKDFICEIIDNRNGCLSPNYPAHLIIPVAERKKSLMQQSAYLDSKNKPRGKDRPSLPFIAEEYRENVEKCHGSRCRSRFVVPVIYYQRIFLCRSGTLTVRKSAAYESATKAEKQSEVTYGAGLLASSSRLLKSVGMKLYNEMEAAMRVALPFSMSVLKMADSDLMSRLGIERIIDLMVEDRKIVNQIRITSSEKVNKDLYQQFIIEQMPFPGAEFFRMYSDAKCDPNGLVFDWSSEEGNSELLLSKDIPHIREIDWAKYKEWDLVELTRNYIAQILAFMYKGKGSILIHGICGWDRTPLFISIIRLSLWADGLIHSSLSIPEMAYLTLAYDWYLFGHDFPARHATGEQIMHFCFEFLPHIAEDSYSLNKCGLKRDKVTLETDREEKLKGISTLVLSLYERSIPGERKKLHIVPPYLL